MMATTMMAVVKPEAAAGAEIRQVKIPAFGRTDVLVKVKVASICGTDVHIYNWDRWAQNRIHPPLIPGHEFCGEVAAFGDEVTSVKEGDFVSAEMHVACGKCLQCRTGEAHICQNVKIIGLDTDGAFAEDSIFKGITVQGINGRRMYQTWYQMTALLKSGKLNLHPVITDRIPMKDFSKAMERLKTGEASKILVYPNGVR